MIFDYRLVDSKDLTVLDATGYETPQKQKGAMHSIESQKDWSRERKARNAVLLYTLAFQPGDP